MPFEKGVSGQIFTRTREKFENLLEQVPEIVFEPFKARDSTMIKRGGSAREPSSKVSDREKEG